MPVKVRRGKTGTVFEVVDDTPDPELEAQFAQKLGVDQVTFSHAGAVVTPSRQTSAHSARNEGVAPRPRGGRGKAPSSSCEHRARTVPPHRYYFRVSKGATRLQIRQAVETIFTREVASVDIVHVQGRQHHMGKQGGPVGAMPWKKAIVTLQADQAPIELHEGALGGVVEIVRGDQPRSADAAWPGA